nr:energy transducer TonB [Gemmatimonadaceae bacterium]
VVDRAVQARAPHSATEAPTLPGRIELRVTMPDQLPTTIGEFEPAHDVGLRGPGAPPTGGTISDLAYVSDGVIDAAAADRAPRLLSGAPAPVYPASLRARGVEGRVAVRFVVDTTGRVEPASVTIVESPDELFTAAVRATLPSLRLMPGEAGGRRVRTLVQMPFSFLIR